MIGEKEVFQNQLYCAPMEAVSKMLGHSNISTTKQYAKIVDTLIINEMKKVQQLYQVS